MPKGDKIALLPVKLYGMWYNKQECEVENDYGLF